MLSLVLAGRVMFRYEGTSMLSEQGEPFFGHERTRKAATKLNTTQLLLVFIILIGISIFYIEIRRNSSTQVMYLPR